MKQMAFDVINDIGIDCRISMELNGMKLNGVERVVERECHRDDVETWTVGL